MRVTVVPMETQISRVVNTECHYEVLNLTKKPTFKEIRTGFRQMAKKFHPDKNHHPKAVHAFHRINDAYRALLYPEENVPKTIYAPVYSPPYTHMVYNPYTKKYTTYGEFLKHFSPQNSSRSQPVSQVRQASQVSQASSTSTNVSSTPQVPQSSQRSLPAPLLSQARPYLIPGLLNTTSSKPSLKRPRHQIEPNVDVAALAESLLRNNRNVKRLRPYQS